MNDQSVEQEIQSKGLTAPRVTPEDIEANIAHEVYFTADHGASGAMAQLELHSRHPGDCKHIGALRFITFCVLILRNGTKIVGINYGAIDPAQHSAERGREEARAHAIEQAWPLMGYALRERLSTTTTASQQP